MISIKKMYAGIAVLEEKTYGLVLKAKSHFESERGDAKTLITVLGFALAAALTVAVVITKAPNTTETWYGKALDFIDQKLGW